MKKKIRSRLTSFLFIIICFLICGASLYYFFTDLNKTFSRNETQIAVIHFKRKLAQRKFSDSVIWDRLQQNSPLYTEDIIRTDTDAAAILSFENGVVVDLDEKTMIQIFTEKDGTLKFAVAGGSFSVDTTEAAGHVKIDIGNGSVINLDKGSRMSGSSENGESAIVIHEGAGSITDSDGKEDFVLAGDALSVDKEGNRKKLTLLVSNMNSVQRVYHFEDEMPVTELSLNVELPESADGTTDGADGTTDGVEGTTDGVPESGSNKKIIVETSPYKDFSGEVKQIEYDNAKKVSLTGSGRTLYYRVYEEGDKEDASVGKIIFETIENPVIKTPLDNSSFEIAERPAEILFSWDAGSYCDYCTIEIYKDDNSLVAKQEVSGSSVKIDSLYQGDYSWKLIPHYSVKSASLPDKSLTQKFSIVKREPVKIPVLSVPVENADLVLNKIVRSVLFAWQADGVGNYSLEISHEKDFSSLLVSEKSSELRKSIPLTINSIPKGEYYWRVARQIAGETLYSDVRSFTVSEYVPKSTELVYPPDNYSAESANVPLTPFTWSLEDGIDIDSVNFRLELATDNSFTNIVKQIKTTKLSYSGLNLEEGNYFWRVKAFDKLNGIDRVFTDVRSIHVVNPLSAPTIIYPASNSTLTLTDGNSFKVSWQAVSGADYYSVAVYDADTNEQLSYYDNIYSLNTTALIPDDASKNSEKNFICSVQAHALQTEYSLPRLSPVSENSFKIGSASRIELLYPRDRTKIEGLTALRNPVVFGWKEDSNPKNKEFVLTRIYSDGSRRVVRRIKNPSKSVSLGRLAAGTYRWTINASLKDGKSVSPKQEYSFTIFSVEPLDRVMLESPVNYLVMDPEYLKSNRTIRFAWKKSSQATDYLLTLYQKNDDGTLKKIFSQKVNGTEYVFKDLAKLDVGLFEWHVTAYVHAKDGFEEQKSVDSSYQFEIQFDLPDTVKTIDPGRMYGN
ncbi:hypothetical protein [Treponema sp.]|uniref:hypothetical protein n=1 Tax=Treponema sp. TaxID=166 RepID=UPI00298E47DA|nr:hypothetical protein [Treponema sp.]MCR5612206.1 hypothetical protein [Treponema sp.]